MAFHMSAAWEWGWPAGQWKRANSPFTAPTGLSTRRPFPWGKAKAVCPTASVKQDADRVQLQLPICDILAAGQIDLQTGTASSPPHLPPGHPRLHTHRTLPPVTPCLLSRFPVAQQRSDSSRAVPPAAAAIPRSALLHLTSRASHGLIDRPEARSSNAGLARTSRQS